MAALESLSASKISTIADATVLYECVSCIRLVVNSRSGLRALAETPQHLKVLVLGKESLMFGVFLSVSRILVWEGGSGLKIEYSTQAPC